MNRCSGPACTRTYVWITRNENLSYGIYHRRRDSRLELRLMRLARRTIFRAAAIYATAKRLKSRAVDDQRRVLRSTALLSTPRRRRWQRWKVLILAMLAVFTSSNCETCVNEMRVYVVTNFPAHSLFCVKKLQEINQVFRKRDLTSISISQK